MEEKAVEEQKPNRLQRTWSDTLFAEYKKKYYDEERKQFEEQISRWDRVKLTWSNIFGGDDFCESWFPNELLHLGGFIGFGIGAIYETASQMDEFRKKHDQFVAAGHLKEKWMLHKTAMFRCANDGLRTGLVCAIVPTLASCVLLTSISYHNAIKPLDFGIVTTASLAAIALSRGRYLNLRYAGCAFGAGFSLACLLNGYFWLKGTSISEYRYNTVHQMVKLKDKTLNEMSWREYENMPEDSSESIRRIRERQLDLKRRWQERAEAKKLKEKVAN